MGLGLFALSLAFFSGRLISYSLYVGGATLASDSFGEVIRSSLGSPLGIALQLVMLAALVGPGAGRLGKSAREGKRRATKPFDLRGHYLDQILDACGWQGPEARVASTVQSQPTGERHEAQDHHRLPGDTAGTRCARARRDLGRDPERPPDGRHGAADRHGAALVQAGFTLVATAARPIGGLLSDRIGGSRVLALVFVGVGIDAIGLSWQASDPSIVPVTAFCLTMALFLGLGNGAVFNLVPLFFPTSTGAAAGIVGAAGGLGGFFPLLLLGIVKDATGEFVLGFVFLVACAWMYAGMAVSLLEPGHAPAPAAGAGDASR